MAPTRKKVFTLADELKILLGLTMLGCFTIFLVCIAGAIKKLTSKEDD